MRVTMGLKAQTTRKIDVTATVLMNLAPALAAIAGGSQTCTVDIAGSYIKSN